MSAAVTYEASLGAILSNITGVLVCDLGEMYDLQDFMAGYSAMTHERPRLSEQQSPRLLAQFPRLAEVAAPSFAHATDKRAACIAWVASVAAHIGWDRAEVVQ